MAASQQNPVRIVADDEAAERARELVTQMRYLGMAGNVDDCRTMIDVPVGRKAGNHSFGAYCALHGSGQVHTIMVCDDDLVGHFGRSVTIPALIGDWRTLADFVVRNCYGG